MRQPKSRIRDFVNTAIPVGKLSHYNQVRNMKWVHISQGKALETRRATKKRKPSTFQNILLPEPLRLRLNHFFLLDLSLLSEPSSPGLSVLESSLENLPLLLPLLKLLAFPLVVTIVLITVKEEWMPSLCFKSSSTWIANHTCQHQKDKKTSLNEFHCIIFVKFNY